MRKSNNLSLLFPEEHELSVPIDNEDWLIRFLRPCKFYPESALELVSKKHLKTVT